MVTAEMGKFFFFFFALSTVGDIRLSFSVRKNKHSSHQGHCTCRLDSFIYSDSNALNMPESTVNGKIYANLKKIYLFMPSACSELLQHHVRQWFNLPSGVLLSTLERLKLFH